MMSMHGSMPCRRCAGRLASMSCMQLPGLRQDNNGAWGSRGGGGGAGGGAWYACRAAIAADTLRRPPVMTLPDNADSGSTESSTACLQAAPAAAGQWGSKR